MISLKKSSIVAVAVVGASIASAQITIPTVPIGNPGNAVDPTTATTGFGAAAFGSVAYAYNIGKFEVTNAQYAAFLNAKAASDPLDLYYIEMALSSGGITRSGSPGSYTYSTVSGRGNNPVNFVNFFDACRFANWLHNGQGSGDTETGAYTLGGVTFPVNGPSITRNAGWQWAVTSENEWYKAAYHQPASAGGDSDNYWLYPTQSNAVPTSAQSNFFNPITGNGNIVPVGSYAANYYGAFDMGGNVFEWNEWSISGQRGSRGGSWFDIAESQRAANRSSGVAGSEFSYRGFRVVQRVAATISGSLTLSNTIGNSGTETIGWTLSNNVNTYTGSVVVTDFGSSAYTLTVPVAAPAGAYTLKLKGGTFLAKTLSVTLSGTSLTSQNAILKNGDIDQDGEVGPSDFELVVAQFGGSGSADVDNDGEVGPADFEIIVVNFGLGDE